jgi:IS1 family transposase
VSTKKSERWVWFALCRQTRQVVACVVGGRGKPTCRQLWKGIPEPYRQGTLFTDFWEAYQAVLPTEQHQAVGKDTGRTARVERFNNTLSQRLPRFTRKTPSFSKSDQMHLIRLHRFSFATT